MRPLTRPASVLVPLFLLTACAADTGPSGYDPDWNAEAPISGGKADGVLDILPVLELGTAVEGEVGGERSEMYRIDLRRTDRIRIEMRVTSGDLDPHLSFFYGTSSYVGSESWNREGNTLEKVYLAESAGSYVVAARAYEGRGSGTYAIRVTCLGGPCAGELPPPESELGVDDVASCIAQARRCSFEALPGYEGRVGEVRASQIFTECLGRSSLSDGASCAAACDWQGDDSDVDYDDARPLCDDVIGQLPFWADQSTTCLGLLDSCMSDCYDAGSYGYHDDGDLAYTVEATCWSGGFNGNCTIFARAHEACGGDIRAESSRECTQLCHSTTGAHIDDLDTLCSSDSDCENYCDVDVDQAGEICGGVTEANRTCLESWVSDNAWLCDDALAARLAGS